MKSFSCLKGFRMWRSSAVPLTLSPIFCVSGGSNFCTDEVISTPGLKSYASTPQPATTSFITLVGTLFT